MNKTVLTQCRICRQQLPTEALICLPNMPAIAQHLPESKQTAIERTVNLSIYQCTKCGVVQHDSEPVHYYRETIRANGISPSMAEHRLSQFSQWVNSYDLKGKTVFEIGSGGGEHLKILCKLGVSPIGIEGNQTLCLKTTSMGIHTKLGYLGDDDLHYDTNSIDAFICLNFLEHMPDPNKVLSKLYQALCPNAVGIIEVPNFKKIIDNNQYSEFITDHIFYFDEHSLKVCLGLNGFEVISCNTHWDDYILSVVVRKRNHLNPMRLRETFSEFNKQIEKFCQKETENVVVWGAGHQSLTILATSQLGKKAKYIVDSAPFKQNLFAPGCALPIYSPDHLNVDPPHSIVVIAAGYNDEIIKTIKKKYFTITNVAKIENTQLVNI